MSSRIARPASMQSLTRSSKRHTDNSFVCNRVNSPVKRNSDSAIRLGQKVRVPSLDLTGTVRFFGATQFKPNEVWVGIELDMKGAGRNDGCIKGVRYFTCSPNSGLFVTVNKVILINTEPQKQTKIIRSNKFTAIPHTPKPTKFTTNQTATPKYTASPPTLKPTKSTATPHTLKPTKSTATPHTPKPTKSTATPHTPKPTKSTATSHTPKPTKSTAVPPKSTKSTAVPKPANPTTTPQPKRTKSTVCPERSKGTGRTLSLQASLPVSTADSHTTEAEKGDDTIAWERLLSAKESYAIQVQEQTQQITQLKRALEECQRSHERMAKETEAALSHASLTSQLQSHVDRLEQRIQNLQKERQEIQERSALERRDQAAIVGQLKRELADRDHALATIEKDYGEMRKIHVDTVRSCEDMMRECREEHEGERRIWQEEYRALESVVNELRAPRQDDSKERQKRLEAQLELTTQELDRERERMQAMTGDMARLKEKLNRMHLISASSDKEYQRLKDLLEKEVDDKKQMMEERGAALEAQAKLEEENERIRLSHDKAQHDLAEMLKRLAAVDKKRQGTTEDELIGRLREENERLLGAQRQSEQECMRLMDELLDLGNTEGGWDHLKTQISRERKRYEDMKWTFTQKVERLNKELVDLESLVENKVFNETELEERLEKEKKRVGTLEVRLKEMERQAMIPTPTSPVAFHLNQPRNYCEICEVYGHDLMLCTALNDLSIRRPEENNFYCVNCDVFDTHPTEQCPNQDETF